jgi:hypothetical protein
VVNGAGDQVPDEHSRFSVLREVIVEHLFVGQLLRELWRRRIWDAEVLHSEFDAGGYDLVLSRRAVTRHIQLKTKRLGGMTDEVSVSLNLATKPSGCIVWIVVTDELEFSHFLWFGGDAGHPLPDISSKRVTTHTKGNSQGVKGERANHRKLKLRDFAKVDDWDHLLGRLLGDSFDDAGIQPLSAGPSIA